jgi:hypothetical protein
LGGLTDTSVGVNVPTSDVWSITPGTGWQQCTGAAPWSARAEMSVVNLFGDKALLMMGGACILRAVKIGFDPLTIILGVFAILIAVALTFTTRQIRRSGILPS